MKYKIYTLGCKLNFAESSTIARKMESQGFALALRGEVAHRVVINSCAVTAQSEKKARELIRRVVRENQGAEVIVTGCYAKLRADEISAIEGVSRVETSKDLTSYSLAERTRSFLKVQDGCDYHCTYCTVWRARGKSRNAPIDEIVSQAQHIASTGVREIVLTGVNIGDFGRSTGNNLFDLIRELDKVSGVERYRISSIEPNLLTEDIIKFCAHSDKFMPHFHIPLQSGCDSVLKAMGRRYSTADFEQKIELVRDYIPNVFIGIDVIVGFPNESDADFEQTIALLERVRPAFLHIFPYSQRPGTKADKMEGQVGAVVKKERVARLQLLCDRLLSEFTLSEATKSHTVLVEGTTKEGRLFGHTENYIRVLFDGDSELITKIVELPTLPL